MAAIQTLSDALIPQPITRRLADFEELIRAAAFFDFAGMEDQGFVAQRDDFVG